MTALDHGPVPRERRRAGVDDVSVVVLGATDEAVATRLLDALAAQGLPLTRLVLTGLDPGAEGLESMHAHPLLRQGVELVLRPPVAGEGEGHLARVLEDARADLPVGDGHWLWLLHPDTVPEPGALAALTRPLVRTSRVGVVGPKVVALENSRRLVAVGHRVTRGGRDADVAVPGQVDQGQLDDRTDVLGVPLAGMLVRSDVLEDLGGLDPAFGAGTEGLDLSWRAHLTGHRVIVEPHAVVRQGPQGRPGRSALTRRRTRQLALARAPWWAAPWHRLAVLLAAVPAALVLLLLQRPRAAGRELGDVAAVLAPWRGWAARRRFRGRRRVPYSALSSLFAPAGTGWRSAPEADEPAGQATSRGADGTARDGTGPPPAAVAETGPVSEEALSLEAPTGRSWWSWPLVLAVTVVSVVAALRWRDLVGSLGGSALGVSGGELGVVRADAASVWHSWTDGWAGAGLGSAQDGGQAWLVPVAGAAWLAEQLPVTLQSPAGTVVAWVLALAPVLAAMSGYAATRGLTPSRWVRAGAAVLWAASAPLHAALLQGRLGPVVAHVLLPLVLAALVAAVTRVGGQGVNAAVGAGLLLGATALAAPVVAVLAPVAGLLVAVSARGRRRWRGLVVAVLPWLLLGPWAGALVADPRLLLGGPGGTTTVGTPVAPWRFLLLDPGGSPTVLVWAGVPLVVLAVVAAARRGGPGRRAAALLLGAVLSLGAALLVPWVQVGTVPEGLSDAGATVTAWPGTLLSLTAACLLLGAVLAVGGGRRPGPPDGGAGPGWRPRLARSGRVALVAVAVLAVAAPTLALGRTAWTGAGAALRAAPEDLPAVLAQQAHGPEAVRALELLPQGRVAAYRLLARESGPWVRDRAAEIVTAATSPAPGPAAERLAELAATLVDDRADADPEGTVQRMLHALGAGYLVVREPLAGELGPRLDATPGLARISSEPGTAVWRVAAEEGVSGPVPVARLRVVDEGGRPTATVPVTGQHGATLADLPAQGGALVVAEERGWAGVSQVRVDGQPVTARPGTWPLAYPLPGDASRLEVTLTRPDATWWSVTAALWALAAFLALPLGTRGRSR